MSNNSIYFIGVPAAFKKRAEKTITSAIKDIRRILHYTKPISVVVLEAPKEMVIPQLGISGSAVGKTGIEVYVDFSRKFSAAIFAAELYASICHEATHLIREDAVGPNASLLDAMINEGVACYIETVLSPNRRIPYIAPIKNERALIKKAKPKFFKKTYNHSEWFFGSATFPKWAGYRLGYLIIEEYQQKKAMPPEKLARTKSGAIFSGSKII